MHEAGQTRNPTLDILRRVDDHCQLIHVLLDRLESAHLHEPGSPETAEATLEAARGVKQTLFKAIRRIRLAAGLIESDAHQDDPWTEIPGPCVLRGSTSSLPVPDLLAMLSSRRMTGTLRVKTEGEVFSLELLQGHVVHAASDDATSGQLLGSILVAKGKVSTRILEDFFSWYQPESGRLGQALESAQLVSRGDLRDALQQQVQEMFDRLYAVQEAAFYFFEGTANDVDERIRLNITELLLNSARSTDERRRELANQSE